MLNIEEKWCLETIGVLKTHPREPVAAVLITPNRPATGNYSRSLPLLFIGLLSDNCMSTVSMAYRAEEPWRATKSR